MIGYVVQGKIFKAVQQTKCSNVQLSGPLHIVHFSTIFPPSIMQLSFSDLFQSSIIFASGSTCTYHTRLND